jgi:nitroreductase
MDKPANADHPIHDIIRERWSPRAFGKQSIRHESLLSIFEAARWAPSANNDQPWYFLISSKDDEAEFGRMLECLVEGNRVWAKTAALLAIAVTRKTYKHNGKPYRHAEYDTGQAVMALALQATALGLRVHQMAGFDAEKAREAYDIPEGYEPMTAIAVGYPGDPSGLPEKLRQAEKAKRDRRILSETLFTGRWGERIDI